MSEFLSDVEVERNYQRQRWGDDHDDEKTRAQWALLLLLYTGRVGEAIDQTGIPPLAKMTNERHQLVKLAAVCYAMAESIDRAIADPEVQS